MKRFVRLDRNSITLKPEKMASGVQITLLLEHIYLISNLRHITGKHRFSKHQQRACVVKLEKILRRWCWMVISTII